MSANIGAELAALKTRLERLERGSKLASASLEDTALQVYDGAGSLRTIVGLQGDGTSGINVVNGGPPPQPSTPTVAPALGGLAVGWDGTNADGSPLPLDWARLEVHAAAAADFEPLPDTLQATMETPQGAISYIPVSGPTYVRVLARNTSGAASPATPAVGPYSPTPVAGEIGIGEIIATMISDGAVTTPKLFANAVTTPKLAAGSVDAVALKADAITGKTITGGTMTGSLIQTAATGERITLNEANANKILVYDASIISAIAELSKRGLLVQGTNGSLLWLDPNATYPTLRLTNAGQSNEAVINVVENSPGSANLGLNSGGFPGSDSNVMKWRTFMGGDFWVAERIRSSDANAILGGRIHMTETFANIAFRNTADTTQDCSLRLQANLASFTGGRIRLTSLATADPALQANVSSGHTGQLLSLQKASADKFTVDSNGVMAASNIVTGTVIITPSAPHTPTSTLITYNCAGSTFRGFATAVTTAIGSRQDATPTPGAGITGVSVSSVTSTSALVWVNRENTTNSTVNWMVIGS